jgi:hypothetical protein
VPFPASRIHPSDRLWIFQPVDIGQRDATLALDSAILPTHSSHHAGPIKPVLTILATSREQPPARHPLSLARSPPIRTDPSGLRAWRLGLQRAEIGGHRRGCGPDVVRGPRARGCGPHPGSRRCCECRYAPQRARGALVPPCACAPPPPSTAAFAAPRRVVTIGKAKRWAVRRGL